MVKMSRGAWDGPTHLSVSERIIWEHIRDQECLHAQLLGSKAISQTVVDEEGGFGEGFDGTHGKVESLDSVQSHLLRQATASLPVAVYIQLCVTNPFLHLWHSPARNCSR